MKHLTFLITFMAMLLLSFGHAQAAQIELDGGVPATGYLSGDTVIMGAELTFNFWMNNDAPDSLASFSHGFEVYTALSLTNPTTSGYFDAMAAKPADADTITISGGWRWADPWNPTGRFDDLSIIFLSGDGKAKDTVGVLAAWLGNSQCIFPAESLLFFYLKTVAHTDGDTICIDSCWYRTSNDWVWGMLRNPPGGTYSIEPSWGGPYCYHVFDTTITDVRTIDGPNLPTTYSLSQNYPNPFNPTTEIHFEIPERAHVTLTVYNVVGQKITTLVDKELMPDRYVVDWDGTSDSGAKVATGVYFYKLQAEKFVETKKMMLLK
jgi:hypothetical protein